MSNNNSELLSIVEENNYTMEKMAVLRDKQTGKIKGVLITDDKRYESMLVSWEHLRDLCTFDTIYPSPFGDEHTVWTPFEWSK